MDVKSTESQKKSLKKNFAKIGGLLLMGGLVMACLLGCTNQKVATRTDFALDTVITITLYGESDESLLKKPFDKIRALDEMLNAHSTESELSKINASAGLAPVQVSKETFGAIKAGLDYGQKSDGAFDITIGPLVDLWQIGAPKVADIPKDELIQEAKALVDYKKVHLNEADNTVYLEQPGMKLNLGAVAKGYIGDEVKTMLLSENREHAVINLGGNVVLIGGKTKTEPLVIGIEDPQNPGTANDQGKANALGVLKARDNTIVTSGDYERYITGPDGKRYHHILNPATGYPTESGLHQVTVITDQSADADALSTTFFIMGLEKSLAYINQNEGIEAIFVTDDRRVVATNGLKEQFTFNSAEFGQEYGFEFITP